MTEPYEPDIDDYDPRLLGPDREEPDCDTCHFGGGWLHDGTNCPECNPTPEQAAAQKAEWDRRVAAGEITVTITDEAPF